MVLRTLCVIALALAFAMPSAAKDKWTVDEAGVTEISSLSHGTIAYYLMAAGEGSSQSAWLNVKITDGATIHLDGDILADPGSTEVVAELRRLVCSKDTVPTDACSPILTIAGVDVILNSTNTIYYDIPPGEYFLKVTTGPTTNAAMIRMQ